MTKRGTILTLCLLLYLSMPNLEARGEGMDVDIFLKGEVYAKGDYTGRFLYVTFLKEGFFLEKRDEHQPTLVNYVGIPYAANARCYLTNGHEVVKMVSSLGDLKGYVLIDSKEKAIEFVRLRTSGFTYFLFRPEIMVEVFDRESKGSATFLMWGAASTEFFTKHKFEELKIEKMNGYFEITRDLLYFPWYGASDYPGTAKLFKVSETVYSDGQYRMTKTLYLSEVNYEDIPYPLLPK